MIDEKRVWGIHTLDNTLFIRENVIAIGWKGTGDLRLLDDRAAFKERYAKDMQRFIRMHRSRT